MSFLDALNPITAAISAVKGIIGQFVPDPQQKAQAELALFQAQAQLQEAMLTAQQQMAEAQSKVIIAEATSQSWIARNWRPLLMLVFTYIILHDYVVAPIFGVAAVPIPDEMWSLLKLGIGGYILGRSAEKTVPDVIAAVKGNGK